MNEMLAFGLLYISAVFYCRFDAAVKEKAYEHSNDTAIRATFHFKSNPFNVECETSSCVATTLKLFNENGEIIEDGWLTGAAALTGFNNTVINDFKIKLNKCISEVNQKLASLVPIKCSKYSIGAQLMSKCIDLPHLKL